MVQGSTTGGWVSFKTRRGLLKVTRSHPGSVGGRNSFFILYLFYSINFKDSNEVLYIFPLYISALKHTNPSTCQQWDNTNQPTPSERSSGNILRNPVFWIHLPKFWWRCMKNLRNRQMLLISLNITLEAGMLSAYKFCWKNCPPPVVREKMEWGSLHLTRP